MLDHGVNWVSMRLGRGRDDGDESSAKLWSYSFSQGQLVFMIGSLGDAWGEVLYCVRIVRCRLNLLLYGKC